MKNLIQKKNNNLNNKIFTEVQNDTNYFEESKKLKIKQIFWNINCHLMIKL